MDLEYIVGAPPMQNMNILPYSNNINMEDYDTFYDEEMKKDRNNERKTNIFELINKYKKVKGISEKGENDNIKNAINWDYETSDDKGIKCRVDHENQLNVVYQDSFLSESDYNSIADFIYKCAEKFYQNNYRIVIIESNNDGGSGIISFALSQMLQAKIQNKFF